MRRVLREHKFLIKICALCSVPCAQQSTEHGAWSTKKMEEFKYLGKKVTKPSKQLDTFTKPENTNYVKFESNELTSFCPVTGQPDFYSICIEFTPDKLCIESKSLKLYLWTFRDEAVFSEALANIILNDIFSAIAPVWCKVTLIQNIRGGLQLTTTAEKKK